MKRTITKMLVFIISVAMILVLGLNLVLQIRLSEQRLLESTAGLFWQMERMIASEEENLYTLFTTIPMLKGDRLFAISEETGKVAGCTNQSYISMDARELGFEFEEEIDGIEKMHMTIDEHKSVCIVQKTGDLYLVRVRSAQKLYKPIFIDTCIMIVYIILISFAVIWTIYRFIDRRVIKGIVQMNNQLIEIEHTGAGEFFSVDTVPELSELSHHINKMVTRIMFEKNQAEHERDTDELTKLYNRRAFCAKMDMLIANKKEVGCGVMMIIDMDGLKYMNDTYGHEVGDQYLQKMAQILMKDTGEKQLVARLGGDEFAIFVYGMKDKNEILEFMLRMERQREFYTLELADGTVVPVQFSLGYAFYPEEEPNYHLLMCKADQRMYTEKKKKKKNKAR